MKRSISRLVAAIALAALVCTGLLPGHAIMVSNTEPGTSVYEVADDSEASVSVAEATDNSDSPASGSETTDDGEAPVSGAETTDDSETSVSASEAADDSAAAIGDGTAAADGNDAGAVDNGDGTIDNDTGTIDDGNVTTEDDNEIAYGGTVVGDGESISELESLDSDSGIAFFALPSTDLQDYLTNASIYVDGELYDNTLPLNPSESFVVQLDWRILRVSLENSLEYTYKLPSEVVGKSVPSGTLRDSSGNILGSYTIDETTIHIKYANVSDVNTTSLKFAATWKYESLGDENELTWGNGITTKVFFDNNPINVVKQLVSTADMPDGSYWYTYGLDIRVAPGVTEFRIDDVLAANYFEFLYGSYDNDGVAYDYQYTCNSGEWQYGNFDSGGGNKSMFISGIDDGTGGQYHIEYRVAISLNDRLTLASANKNDNVINTATASGVHAGELVSMNSSVTKLHRKDSSSSVLAKSAKDVTGDLKVPWRLDVNSGMHYSVAGATVLDQLKTDGVTYDISNPIYVTYHGVHNTEWRGFYIKWVPVPSHVLDSLTKMADVSTELLWAENESTLSSISAAIAAAYPDDPVFGPDSLPDMLSKYAFVDASGTSRFFWVVAEDGGDPTYYQVQYSVDVSSVTDVAVENIAHLEFMEYSFESSATRRVTQMSFKKYNTGVRIEDGNYYVDWFFDITVPAGSAARNNFFIKDSLPYTDLADVLDVNGKPLSTVHDWMVGMNDNVTVSYDSLFKRSLPFGAGHKWLYPAFDMGIETDSETMRQTVQSMLDTMALDNSEDRQVEVDFRWVKEDGSTSRYSRWFADPGRPWAGQFLVTEGEDHVGEYVSIERFYILFKELPAAEPDNGYTITVKYTTQIPPCVLENVEGEITAENQARPGQIMPDGSQVSFNTEYSRYYTSNLSGVDPIRKQIIGYDVDAGTITYRIDIDKLGNMRAFGWNDYVIKDQMDVVGATYIEDSFVLLSRDEPSFRDSDHHLIGFTRMPDADERPIWPEYNDGSADDQKYIAKRIKFSLHNSDADNPYSYFSMFFDNRSNNYWTYLAPSEYEDNFASLALVYTVQLPAITSEHLNKYLTNRAQLYQQESNEIPILVDESSVTYKYTSALHKQLTVPPSASNSYVATFIVDVNTRMPEWPTDIKQFVIQDEMSKSLDLIVTSIELYGANSGSELLKLDNSSFAGSYNTSGTDVNALSVQVWGQPLYDRYQLRYRTRVVPGQESSVKFENIAYIKDTDIESGSIDEDLIIAGDSGAVVQETWKLGIYKYDADDIQQGLAAGFELDAWNTATNAWVPRLTGLRTDGDGFVTITNDDHSKYILAPGQTQAITDDTFYRLRETDVPEGYVGVETYFYMTPRQVLPDTFPDGLSADDVKLVPMSCDSGVYLEVADPRYVEPDGPRMPLTGGIGTHCFYLAAGIILMAAGVICRRRRELVWNNIGYQKGGRLPPPLL